jgi:hypothetical protein
MVLLMVWPVIVQAQQTPDTANAEPMTQWEWGNLWSRDAGTGKNTTDVEVKHQGRPTIRVEHTGARDWNLPAKNAAAIAVGPGDILELSAWVKVQGEGNASVGFVTYSDAGKVAEWEFGSHASGQTDDWTELRSRIVVPADVSKVLPRFTGVGPATVWMEGFTLVRAGNVAAMREENLPAAVTIENAAISVRLDCNDLTLSVLDRGAGKTWKQANGARNMVLRSLAQTKTGLTMDLLQVTTGLALRAVVQLDGDLPELTVSLTSGDKLSQRLAFPYPFRGEAGCYLAVPMNEGVSYPVDDPSIEPMDLVAYGGHGICMAFWGVTNGKQGQMTLIETPDDCTLHVDRNGGLLCAGPMWEAQKGAWGYERKLRYVFLDHGGHVAMCKRYREYARQIGLLKTFAEKRKSKPSIDQLIGAVNVWCMENDGVPIAREMQAAGIGRILWSKAGSPKAIRTMNDLGILTSRYDIYQDVMDPAEFPRLRYVADVWPTAAWPKDIVRNAAGHWVHGWGVETKQGDALYPCGVVCDLEAIPFAQARLTDDLKTHPYHCRFIDTTTASAWRECYDPNHPMTRSDSKHWRMKLLKLVSEQFGMVTGSETGHDAAVPYADYFEGMLSLTRYRVPDAGRNMEEILTDVPPDLVKFQVGPAYRLPLWELVYHDCVVAQWYWGDYNNKLPAIWHKRDLFNALYGTPPMFMFNREKWEANKARFVQSYNATCPIARATGYAEMTDHEFLTPDRSVQRTRFANGVSVTVNFGDSPFTLPEGSTIAPRSSRVEGIAPAGTRSN